MSRAKEWTELTSKSADTPIVLDFYAKYSFLSIPCSWCGPSRTLDPLVEKNVRDAKGRLVLAKVNVDECGDLIHEFGVTAIPHLALVHRGRVVAQSVGVANDEKVIGLFRCAEKLAGK
eukprot:TRINITY_DN4764_c0_g5_i1.p1 TRINITY_DN4764_c0_g5~~TRINITY_DN4764_c0_g5_i1.p1  ORF type:complete len:118 (+),score=23.23 TRINITY_DN4764_c0_g5_i1:228-581(+)